MDCVLLPETGCVLDDFDDFIAPLLLRSHMHARPFGCDHIRAYNHLVTHFIPAIVEEKGEQVIRSDTQSTELRITFTDARVTGPLHTEPDTTTKVITPQECRLRELTYAGRIVATMHVSTFNIEADGEAVADGPARVYRDIPLCNQFPIMTGSQLCTGTDDVECTMDNGGYFIIRGYAKICQVCYRVVYCEIASYLFGAIA